MRNELTHHVLLAALCLAVAVPAFGQEVTFDKVKARFQRSATDRRLVYKDVGLVLDDQVRRMVVKSKDRPLDVSYDDIDKVIFEVTTQMRGGAFSKILGGAVGGAVGGVAESLIAARHVNDYWCYLEYRTADGEVESYLLEIDKDQSPDVIGHLQKALGDRTSIPEFAENAGVEDVEKDLLGDIKSKHDAKADKDDHPMPELQEDKALVVIVSPALAARDTGKGNQIKIHVDDRVEAVNKLGTYTWFYLEPGDYQLVSQAGNASALQVAVEAGMDYYFLQNTFSGTWKSNTSLSRHSKELVMYELNGAYHSVWNRKE